MLAQGLISVNATSGLISILANRVSPSSSKYPGAEVIFADDLDVASDGTVYFSTMTDIAPLRGASGHYEAMPPCILNIMQVRCSCICALLPQVHMGQGEGNTMGTW